MVIGVDAGALAETDKRLQVGVHRVTVELLKHISRIDTKNQYRLYSFAPIPHDVMQLFGKNMRNIVLLPSVGYMKIRLPLKLLLQPVDIFLGLAQAVPYGVTKAIGCIYDLGFIQYPEVYGDHAKKLVKQTEQVVSRSSHIVTISEASKKDIIQTFGIKPERISVCYPGVSEVFVKNKNTATCEHPYFLHVGLLKPGKNIPIALQAFAEVLKKTKRTYDLVIIGGDKGLDPAIHTTIHDLHLEERVKLLGYVSDEEIATWYKGANAFIALSETEGFCLPAVESLVSGCPVIYANSGALPEIVGDAGIGVDVRNSEEIARAMMMIKRNTFTSLCKKQAARFDWSTCAKQIYDILTI